MFFINAETLAPLGEYVNKIFGNLFDFKKFKLAPIMPINAPREDSYHVNIYGYSTEEELYDLV